MITRFHLEDRGQDCLFLDVEHKGSAGLGKVIGCNTQFWVWADGKHYVNLDEPHGKGARLVTTDDLELSIKTGYSRMWNYPVVKTERISLARFKREYAWVGEIAA